MVTDQECNKREGGIIEERSGYDWWRAKNGERFVRAGMSCGEQECRVVGVMGDLCIKGIVPGLDTCDSVMETASGMVH